MVYYIDEIRKKNNKIQTSCTRLSYKRPLSRTVCVCRVAWVKLIDTRVRGIPRPDISAAAARSARNKWVSARTYQYLIIPVCLPAYIIQWKYKPTVPNLLHSSIYRSQSGWLMVTGAASDLITIISPRCTMYRLYIIII